MASPAARSSGLAMGSAKRSISGGTTAMNPATRRMGD